MQITEHKNRLEKLLPTPIRALSRVLVVLIIYTCPLYAAPNAGPNKIELKQGVFLVATNHLNGTSFQKTVILITRYSANGAMGLAINRPSEFQLSDLDPSLGSLDPDKILYLGGPVHPESVLILTDSIKPQGGILVVDNMYLGGGQKVLKQLLSNAKHRERVRAYAGYTGWAPGQLEAEIKRGDWVVSKAKKSSIFENDVKNLWNQLTKHMSGRWI